MKNDFNSFKNIDTQFLKIKKNCLEIQNTTIQLSNISLFSTADITPEKFPIFSIVLLWVGIVLLKYLIIPGLIAIALGAIWIYFWYSKEQKNKKYETINYCH